MPRSQWTIKADADSEHPDTERMPYLMGHGMDAEVVYAFVSNPVNQIELSGRQMQVYHVKRDSVNEGQPVETGLSTYLRNQVAVVDPVHRGIQHPPERVVRTAMFSWVDTSVGTAKRFLASIGENLYNLNPRKPNG